MGCHRAEAPGSRRVQLTVLEQIGRFRLKVSRRLPGARFLRNLVERRSLLFSLSAAISSNEVWLFDLGMAEKVRPALVVSVGYGDLDRA